MARLLEQTMGETFRTDGSQLMYDQVTVASVIDSSIVKKVELFVDVDTNSGINYGVSVGGRKIWPGAEGARLMEVQYDLDWERFIELFIRRVSSD